MAWRQKTRKTFNCPLAVRRRDGLLGAVIGGVTSTAGGITAAIFLGVLVAVIFKPKPKG